MYIDRLLGDRVLIEPLPDVEVSSGGIVIPETARIPRNKGIVRQLAQGATQEFQQRGDEVKPDNIVLYSRYAGTEIAIEGVTMVIVKSHDIIAIIDEPLPHQLEYIKD